MFPLADHETRRSTKFLRAFGRRPSTVEVVVSSYRGDRPGARERALERVLRAARDESECWHSDLASAGPSTAIPASTRPSLGTRDRCAGQKDGARSLGSWPGRTHARAATPLGKWRGFGPGGRALLQRA